MQINDFVLWVVPKHLSFKSLVHSVYTFVCVCVCVCVDSPPGLASHFFFFAKTSSFIKTGISSKY